MKIDQYFGTKTKKRLHTTIQSVSDHLSSTLNRETKQNKH